MEQDSLLPVDRLKRLFCVLVAALLTLSVVTGPLAPNASGATAVRQAPVPDAGPEARKADQKLRDGLVEAEKAYLQAQVRLKEQYVSDLEGAMKLAMRQQNTDRVAALNTAIAEAKRDVEATKRQAAMVPLISRWRTMTGRYRAEDGTVFTLTFDAEGNPAIRGAHLNGDGSTKWGYADRAFLFDWNSHGHSYAITHDPSDGTLHIFMFLDRGAGRFQSNAIPAKADVQRRLQPVE
ncbi:MAG: hypothetical protein ACFCVE_16130 [Phycisphaerae bacterium]